MPIESAETDPQRPDRRRRYEAALRLWEGENPIKTQKLQVLLLTNALLVPAFFAVEGGLGPGRAAVVALVALGADLVWVFSLGRTVAYQRLWKRELERIQGEDPRDPLLSLHSPARESLPWWGRVRSSSYLVGSPIALSGLWLALLLWALACACR